VRFLRGKLEVAGSEEGADGEKVVRRRIFLTIVQVTQALFHNRSKNDVNLMQK